MYAELAGTVGQVIPDYNRPFANIWISRLTTVPLPTEGNLPSYPPSADREISRLTTPPSANRR